MRRFLYGFAIILTLLPGLVAGQTAVTTYPAPWGASGNTVSLAVSSVTANVQLGWAALSPLPTPPPPSARVCNTGSTNAYVVLGNSAVVATTGGVLIVGGACNLIAVNTAQYLAGITAAGTTTLTIATGTGSPATEIPTPTRVTIGVDGLAFNQYSALDYGSCVWDGATNHDVGPCINAALAAAAAAGGGVAVVPASVNNACYWVATQITNGTNGVKLRGAGIGVPRDTVTPGNFFASTRLCWNGANNATMANWAPSGSTSMFDAGVEGVLFDCNAIANVCFKATQVSFSTFRIGVAESLQIGAWFTTNAGSDSPGTQHNVMYVFARHTGTSNLKTVGTVTNSCPTGIVLDGNATWNTSINPDIRELYAWFNCGDGIVLGNIDENEIGQLGTFPEPGVNNGRPAVFANAGYVMPNGLTINGGAYHNRVFHSETPIYMLGFNTGVTVTQGVHGGTGVYNPVTIATNATTAQLSTTLNFASTAGIVAGQTIDCGAGSNQYRDDVIASVTGTTLVTTFEAYGLVPSGKSCTSHVGMTSSAASGSYTITAVDGTHLSITAAPVGGHTQANILIASGAVVFTDMVFPITGTPNTGDTWTVTVPVSTVFTTNDWTDRNNSVALAMYQPGATAGFVGTSNGKFGTGTSPLPGDGTGALRAGGILYPTAGVQVGATTAVPAAGQVFVQSSLNLNNSATINSYTSGGVGPKTMLQRFSDNKTYLDGGSAGLVLRDNDGVTTIGTSDGSGDLTLSNWLAFTGTTLPTQAAGKLGIGGIASAPTLAANGEGDFYLTTANGLMLQGQGSARDLSLVDKGGTTRAYLRTGAGLTVAGLDWVNQADAGNRINAAFDSDSVGNLVFSPVGSGTGKSVQFGGAATVPQHLATGQTTAPAVTTCNQGGGSPSIVGTDTAGEVTTGTLATSCVVTFNVAYVAAPFCVVTWQASLASTGYTVSNTAITFTQTATTGEKVNYICIGRSGG